MDALYKFMQRWKEYLDQEMELKKRIKHIRSTIDEGRAVVEVDVKSRGVFTIELKEKRFILRKGKAVQPLLSWSVPASLFKEMLLGKERILYAILDKGCTLSFDTPHFTHWDGTTALAVVLAAQEMVKRVPEVKKMVEEI
jgi:hypothetical protein